MSECSMCHTEQGPFSRVLLKPGERSDPVCRDCAQDLLDATRALKGEE